MADATAKTFRCDAPGCKSTCTLPDPGDDLPKELTWRGWAVTDPGSADERHYCQAHHPNPQDAEEEA